MGIPGGGGGVTVKDTSACGRGREMLYIDMMLYIYILTTGSSHMLGYGGGGGRAQKTWTIDLNQTTDNVWSQIKE